MNIILLQFLNWLRTFDGLVAHQQELGKCLTNEQIISLTNRIFCPLVYLPTGRNQSPQRSS